MLKRVKINNFFRNQSLDWGIPKGISILAGFNGSGKTHLLKKMANTHDSLDFLNMEIDKDEDDMLMYYDFSCHFPIAYELDILQHPLLSSFDKSYIVEIFMKDMGDSIVTLNIINNEFVFHDRLSHVIPYGSVSRGMRKYLLLLTIILLSRLENTIPLIEMPETSISISVQHLIIKRFLEIHPSGQFIITTHSPSIISDYMNQIVIMEDILIDKERREDVN